MALSEATIKELGVILKEDYGWEGSQVEVVEIANSLVSYFNVFAGIYARELRNNEYDNATVK